MTKRKIADEIAALREMTWTPEEAGLVLAACAASGKTQTAFAREHGLRQERLSFWRSRLRRGEGSATASTEMVRFVPAVVKQEILARTIAAQAVVRMPCGVTVEIAEASPCWVASLVRSLCEAKS